MDYDFDKDIDRKSDEIFDMFYENDKIQKVLKEIYDMDIHTDIEWYLNYNYTIWGDIYYENKEGEQVLVQIGTPRYGGEVHVVWTEFADVSSPKSYTQALREEIYPPYGADWLDEYLEVMGYYNIEVYHNLTENLIESKIREFKLFLINQLMKKYGEDYRRHLEERGFEFELRDGRKEPLLYEE